MYLESIHHKKGTRGPRFLTVGNRSVLGTLGRVSIRNLRIVLLDRGKEGLWVFPMRCCDVNYRHKTSKKNERKNPFYLLHFESEKQEWSLTGFEALQVYVEQYPCL